jgi:exopolysaccharide biosynthesis polyprenyl glycosylphosphotransferase
MVPFDNLDRVLRSSLDGSHGFWRRCGFDEIVACYTENTPREALAGLSQASLSGLQVSDYSSFMERTFFRVPVEQIGPEWFFQLGTSGDYALYRAAKRLADVILAGVGLLLAAPILFITAVLIRLESDGPAFYSQVRIGQFGRPFRIWKLRSMRNDAEKNGAQWAQERDTRITRIGRILRRTRLDEVPQFINVLKGEMSLVGPRPERPEFVSKLAKQIPFYQQRHMLKPGITGWAQINHPYGATPESALNKLKYDLYYLKYASAILDLQIVLRTIGAVMKGAR